MNYNEQNTALKKYKKYIILYTNAFKIENIPSRFRFINFLWVYLLE